ncbi:MAG: metallophosphatase family protein [Firmicutes bacterium]|nr:metallophosphatase family protein [Bacillota bacterium]
MRLAILGDIHGNLPALQQVLQDIQKEQVDAVYCTGDLVGYGPEPNEVLDLLRDVGVQSVMGNHDDAAGYNLPVCGCAYPDEVMKGIGEKSLAWTKEKVNKVNREFLRGLPEQMEVLLPSSTAMVFHGSPRAINEYIHRDTDEEILQELVEGTEASIFLFGHTHIPFVRTYKDRLFVNAGSVGQPKDGDNRSCYVLLECHPGGISIVFKRVPYDFQAVAARVIQAGLPPELAEILRKGYPL